MNFYNVVRSQKIMLANILLVLIIHFKLLLSCFNFCCVTLPSVSKYSSCLPVVGESGKLKSSFVDLSSEKWGPNWTTDMPRWSVQVRVCVCVCLCVLPLIGSCVYAWAWIFLCCLIRSVFRCRLSPAGSRVQVAFPFRRVFIFNYDEMSIRHP